MSASAMLERTARPKDATMVSPYREADFRREGLRPYNLYRETPLAAMTGGRFGARVQRSLEAVPGPQGLHVHMAEFQLIYVLKGEVSFWYDGLGDVSLGEGAIVYQPRGIVHQMTDLSKGCEILEVVAPNDFPTRECGLDACGGADPVVVSTLDRGGFRPGGLRPYNLYRETGIAAATGGRFDARVQRSLEAVPGPQGLHVHMAEFQLIYVLKGEVSFWYEGIGGVDLTEGAIVYQPKGVLHQMTDLSKGCEILEITMPAEFETRAVD